MLRLLKQMKAKQWIMALLCVALILGQIYFDLRLPDYMSDLTVQIKTPGSTVSDVLHTGLEMLACTLISAVMAILCGYLNAQVAAGFSYHIRESVFQKVADFGQKEMLEFSVPSLINRTTNDITQIQMFVAMGMQTMIKAPVMAVWAVIKIVNKSWTLSVITDSVQLLLTILMTAHTAMTGALIMVCMPMATNIWICVISFVVRLIRLGTENSSISFWPKSATFWNTLSRM